MKKTPWMVRTAYRLSALVLAGALTGCAVAPQHPGLQAAQEAGQLAPLLPVRAFVANTERTGGFVMSPNGERLLWSQTVGLDTGLAVRAVQANAPVSVPRRQSRTRRWLLQLVAQQPPFRVQQGRSAPIIEAS